MSFAIGSRRTLEGGMTLHISQIGRALIEKYEGCRLQAYQDSVGVWTIGYGCTGPNIAPGMRITQAEADQMLSDRLTKEFEPGVIKAIGATATTQAQFDAMVSLAFNIGVGAFSKSSVARLHKLGQATAAADAFLLWNKAGGNVLAGLVKRRAEERKLYLSAGNPQKPSETGIPVSLPAAEDDEDVLDGSYRSQPDRLKYAKRALAGAAYTHDATVGGNAGQSIVTPAKPAPSAATPEQVQQRLVELGFPVVVDGKVGPRTLGAIMAALA